MWRPIEDYALLSDCHSAALVGKDGSIDWLAFPCFDSSACFSSLLGDKENGQWRIAPQEKFEVKRSYIEGTMVLQTLFKTEEGSCKITDCMLLDDKDPTLIRLIEGLDGQVKLELELLIRFDYGSIIPWVRRDHREDGIHALGGPDGLVLYSQMPLVGKNLHSEAKFTIGKGEKKSFTLSWFPSHLPIPNPLSDPWKAVHKTVEKWQSWTKLCSYTGHDEKSVKRSLITLKGLIYHPTGAIVAAPTTSLPEELGGVRNWDYRFSWLRDSSFTLYALLKAGYTKEAISWQDWLHRAVAGTPSQVNIMYGIRGERRLTEIELDWLKGYENSHPVRIGNDAHKQFQLDVYGEVMSTASVGWKHGLHLNDSTWRIQSNMIEFVCDNWVEPDEGIWEVRGPRRHFTHSKLMAWVALNCGIEAVSRYKVRGDVDKWIRIREQIKKEICEKGFNRKLNSFVQHFGSSELDASLLMMSHVGFLPPNDPRLIGTVNAIQKNLMIDGHVIRYRTKSGVDCLPGSEGSFIPCSFWLVDNLLRIGRNEEALEHYQAIQKIKNDVGLYSEEYSIKNKRLVGNFPQAFSHIAEVVTAMGFEESGIFNANRSAKNLDKNKWYCIGDEKGYCRSPELSGETHV